MSKERLEEIIEQVKKSDEYAEMGDWEASDSYLVKLHNEGHINYLIERVQELEEMNRALSVVECVLTQELNHVDEINKRYSEALENIKERETIIKELPNGGSSYTGSGLIARKALEE